MLPAAAPAAVPVDADDGVALARAVETIDELERVLDVPDLHPEVARRLRQRRSELSSHVLAAQVLVDSGASRATVTALVRRASAIVAEVRGGH